MTENQKNDLETEITTSALQALMLACILQPFRHASAVKQSSHRPSLGQTQQCLACCGTEPVAFAVCEKDSPLLLHVRLFRCFAFIAHNAKHRNTEIETHCGETLMAKTCWPIRNLRLQATLNVKTLNVTPTVGSGRGHCQRPSARGASATLNHATQPDTT